MTGTIRPTIQFTGDAFDDGYVSWEIHNRPGSVRCAILDPIRIKDAVAQLTAALPGARPDATTWAALPPLPAPLLGRQHNDLVRGLHAALNGPLRDPGRERELMGAVARALLPDAFIADLLALRTRDDLPLLRLAPSPIAAQVPWALLPVDETADLRLIDVCDLAFVGPLVDRDLRVKPPEPWSEVRLRPCLHVIDPIRAPLQPRAPSTGARRVLSGAAAGPWEEHAAHHPGCSCQEPIDRIGLSAALQVPRSRLFFVGHVRAAPTQDGTRAAGLVLCDTRRTYAIGAARTNPPLTDVDLVRGVPVRGDRDRRMVPALAEETDEAVAGKALWPMPPRVALIACESGPDLRTREPFGLVTAAMLGGAQIVTATLWTLPTDHAYAGYGGAPRFSDLVRAADRIQQANDPVTALSIWQRQRLADWRTSGDPDDSPLWWAGVVTFHTPPRGVPVHQIDDMSAQQVPVTLKPWQRH